ncbi:hypothetical protein KKG31_02480 [Patescibacteria group bacterium]|nr:hypothetical protein [Patescibacteria group bacterium]MBU1758032.1 hypothetical protein [Patescibacteria group bacterium]
MGRYILEGEKKVKMMGIELAVNADVEKINGFSGHADANQLIDWANGFENPPKKTFVVHGE